MTRAARRAAWVLLAAVVAGALVIASAGDRGGPATAQARADAIGDGVRCPTCRGQAVTDSAAPAATAIREEIERRIRAGQSEAQVESYLVGRYGEDILLTPPSRGVGGLVWVLPVLGLGIAGGVLGIALRRWSRRTLASATEADRALVERASRMERA
ncbi:MAG TPA: cytochrome c-type biogenesis protein CcmH [Acidimicrobiales bacterium]|nr:cytochrome c-type biogenesis protein CcmH [Acidimicrobiales bacterium]